jgi:hypothetical protein
MWDKKGRYRYREKYREKYRERYREKYREVDREVDRSGWTGRTQTLIGDCVLSWRELSYGGSAYDPGEGVRVIAVLQG